MPPSSMERVDSQAQRRRFAKAGTESRPLGTHEVRRMASEYSIDALEEIPQDLLISMDERESGVGLMSFFAFLVLIGGGVSALGAFTPASWWQVHPALANVHAAIKVSNARMGQALGLSADVPSVQEVTTRPSATELTRAEAAAAPAAAAALATGSADTAPTAAASPTSPGPSAPAAAAAPAAPPLEIEARLKAKAGKGRLTHEVLGTVLDGLAGRVKECWMSEEGELASARAMFSVARTGKAKKVRVKVRGGEGKVDECLTSLIKETRFPPAKRATRAVTYEWRMKSDRASSAAAPRLDSSRAL